MSQITPFNTPPKWLGTTDKTNSQDLTGLLKAKQQADQAQGMPFQPKNQSSAAQLSAAAVQRYQASYQYSETMSMQIETKEGDKVTVDFRQLYAQYQEFNRQQMMQEGPSGVRYFESREALEMTAFEERFAFSVEGDLNEDELKAIFDVFEQVDRLANDFFNGDIEKAFEQALDLKIDFGQIKSFSLDLTKTESRAVSYQQGALAQYKDVQSQDQKEGQDVNVNDLPPYLQAWQSAIESLDAQFANARELFDEMMAGSLAQRFPEQDSREGWLERVQKLHQGLTELFDSSAINKPNEPNEHNNESLADAEKI